MSVKKKVNVYEMGEALLSLRLGQMYYNLRGTRLMLPGYAGREIKAQKMLEGDNASGGKDVNKDAEEAQKEDEAGSESLPMIMPVQVEPPKKEDIQK